MPQSFRQPEILEIARREGRVTVEALSAHFDVTSQTVRRDLSELAEAGKLERVHGGAVLPSGATNIEYEARRLLSAKGKRRIAAHCAGKIPAGSSVFLNIGTTTEAVARALLDHKDLLVVTNNLNVAGILAGGVGCRVTVTGGRLRQGDGGLLGASALNAVRQFKPDIAVIGCSAVDAHGDLLDFDPEEVALTQEIILAARQSWLVADHSKLQRHAPGRIASLAQIDAFFTDASLPAALASRCADWATDVQICE